MKTLGWFPIAGALFLLLLILAGCGAPASPAATIALSSSAFEAGGAIPRKYSCDAEDVSPPLQWAGPPAGTRSFALVVDDPDAGGFRHWLVYNIPAAARALPEAVPAAAELSDGSRQGNSSWNRLGYGGPCPPSGTHRYSFRLYALDTVLELAPGATLEQLQQAMAGHVLAQGELLGTYARQK